MMTKFQKKSAGRNCPADFKTANESASYVSVPVFFPFCFPRLRPIAIPISSRTTAPPAIYHIKIPALSPDTIQYAADAPAIFT